MFLPHPHGAPPDPCPEAARQQLANRPATAGPFACAGTPSGESTPITSGRLPRMLSLSKRLGALVSLATMFLLSLAAPALAADGVGLAGRVSDATITFFCFGVIIFFILFVIVASIIQGRLDSRKERARADLERLRRP